MRIRCLSVIFSSLALSLASAASAATSAPSDLTGTWVGGCTVDQSASEFLSYTYTGNNASMSSDAFADTNCSSKVINVTLNGTFNLAQVDSGASFTQVDYTTATVMMTVAAEEYVQYFNQNSFCGFNDWVVNVAKNVTGKSCSAGGQTSNMPKAGDKMFDIAGLDGKKLYSGDQNGHDGTTDGTRPVALDMTKPYVKQ